jgi:hypothetical protein
MKIEIGTELNVNGKWCIVDNVYENVVFAIDQEGGEIEIRLWVSPSGNRETEC